MALDGCGLVCKFILLIFNIFFALLGAVFLGLGLWLRFSNSTRGIFEIEAVQSSAFVLAVGILIGLGLVMLIVVTFGDFGACNGQRCCLQVFSVLLAILVVADIVAVVLVNSKRAEVAAWLVEVYGSLYALYMFNGDAVIGVTLKFIHSMLDCCGMTGVPVLEVAVNTCPKPTKFIDYIVKPNCPGVIIDAFISGMPMVTAIFIATGALLITVLICAAVLLKHLKKAQQEITTHYTTVY